MEIADKTESMELLIGCDLIPIRDL